MIIVKQSVKIVGMTYAVEEVEGRLPTLSPPEKLIEKAGRVCYKSEDRITPDSHIKFVDKTCNQLHHESIMEHGSVSFHCITNRAIGNEAVRHRLCSFSQESTRYCNYGNEKFGDQITVIEPPGLTPEQRSLWGESMLDCEYNYLNLLAMGCPAQTARGVLPLDLKTELFWTANFREWKHILKLRTAPAAHPQMQELAKMIEVKLMEVAPVLFPKKETT